jgi:hypothetical protein
MAGMLPIQPDPPVGTAEDPERQSVTTVIPSGALLCCVTDGLVLDARQWGSALARSGAA